MDSLTGRDVVTIKQRLAKEQNCMVWIEAHGNRLLDVEITDRILQMEDGQLQLT
jgi:putative ABC transport system ATP-binding protein